MEHQIRRPWVENAILAGVALFILTCVFLIRAF
jgi:hypothetical protein